MLDKTVMNGAYDSYKRYQPNINAKCVIKFMFHLHYSRDLINQTRIINYEQKQLS